MKEEPNNEMDLMLRRLGRTMNRPVRHSENGGGDSGSDGHLDADELNAYAENALPEVTRARYTEHVADCTRCRKIVSQLSQAAGLVFEEKTSPRPAVTGLGKFFSSLFTPMVLRYVVPALGLILVATLGLSVFRSRSTPQEAAMNKAADAVAQRTDSAAEPPAPSAAYNRLEDRQGQKPTIKAGEQTNPENKKSDVGDVDTARVEREEKRQEPASSVDQIAAATPAPVTKSEAPPAKEFGADKKATPSEAADDARRGQAVTAAPTSVSVEQQKETAKMRDNEGNRQVSGLSAASSKAKNEVSRAKAQPGAAIGGIAAAERADKDESETRSVAGHRFQRKDSRWVDVTYDSRATTNVAPGSEQYRALIADEPSIKTIADQLDGEIIVMWNNRAYRIR